MTNAPPTAQDFTAYPHLAPLRIDVLPHAEDPDGQVLKLSAVGRPAHGHAVIGAGAVVYTPGPDFTGDDSVTYTVSDGFGGTASATIHLVDRMLGLGGAYSGSVRSSDVDHSLFDIFRLTLSQTGTFTGTFPGGLGAVIGTFDGDGYYDQRTTRFGHTYRLRLHLDPATQDISGRFYLDASDDFWDDMSGGLQRYSAAKPFPRAGTYTFSIDSSGYTVNRTFDSYYVAGGFGYVTVGPAGNVRVIGKLGDGATFSAGSTIFQDHSCVFTAAPLYGAYQPGTLVGDFHFKDDGTNDLEGDVYHSRDILLATLPGGYVPLMRLFPPGYFGWLSVTGSRVPAAPLLSLTTGQPNVQVEFASPSSDAGFIDRFATWAANDSIQVDAAQKLTLHVNETTGLFSGSFFDPQSRRQEAFAGAILSRQGYGAGFYLSAHGRQNVTITPKTSP
jgi:hypothetical protein